MLGSSSLSRANRRRFNLLMLEDREYLFADYGGFLHLPAEYSSSASSSSPSPSAPIHVPFHQRKKVKGRLHVCSKSLIFDPDDSSLPLYRIPLTEVVAIRPSISKQNPMNPIEYFLVQSTVVIEVLPRSPWIFRRYDLASPLSELAFSLSYEKLDKFLPLLHNLHDICRSTHTLSPSGVGGINASKNELLSKLIAERESKFTFDTSWILDFREKALLPTHSIVCSLVTPLVTTPGLLYITDLRIYFQPFNNSTTEPVFRYSISDIQRMYKRRFIMREVGLEIFYLENKRVSVSYTSIIESQSSVYLSFSNRQTRDDIYQLISSQSSFQPAKEQSLLTMTERWVRGDVSNYDYIMFLNQQGGRSYQDLTQYPVFPWVIADYTSKSLDLSKPSTFRDLSKPIGALDATRLSMFERRKRDMPMEVCNGKPFLYGTHYSTPGYVLYFLVRKVPEYQLKLQNGRFDHPDRLFHSIASTWESCLTAPTDVKELIPEFYCTDGPHSKGDFLVNELGLDLGIKHNGREVDHVELPPWSHSPKDFISKCRQALESDYVSNNLHHWIDLIFGYKQSGPEAEKANNVFYYLTYEGAVDLDSVSDPVQRRSLESQIQEFGQTPKQIFAKPHPARFSGWTASSGADIENKQVIIPKLSSNDTPISPRTTPSSPPPPPSAMSPSSSSSSSLQRGQSGRHKANSSFSLLSSSPSSSASVSPRFNSTPTTSSLLQDSTVDARQDFEVYSQRTPTAIPTIEDISRTSSADRDAVALAREVDSIAMKSLNLIDLNSPMPSTPSTSSSSKSSSSDSARQTNPKPSTKRRGEPKWKDLSKLKQTSTLNLHRDQVTDICFSADESLLFSVSADSHIKAFQLGDGKLFRSTRICDLTLSCCGLTSDGSICVVGSWDDDIYLYQISQGRVGASMKAHDDAVSCLVVHHDKIISGSWDSTVKLWQIRDGEIPTRPLADMIDHETHVQCLAIDASGNLVVSGSEDGNVLVWDLRSHNTVATFEAAFTDQVASLDFVPNSNEFVAVSKDGTMKYMDCGGSTMWSLPSKDKLNCVKTDGHTIVTGGEAGVIRIWDVKTVKQTGELASKGSGTLGINTLALSDDGTTLVTGHTRKFDNQIIWNVNE